MTRMDRLRAAAAGARTRARAGVVQVAGRPATRLAAAWSETLIRVTRTARIASGASRRAPARRPAACSAPAAQDRQRLGRPGVEEQQRRWRVAARGDTRGGTGGGPGWRGGGARWWAGASGDQARSRSNGRDQHRSGQRQSSDSESWSLHIRVRVAHPSPALPPRGARRRSRTRDVRVASESRLLLCRGPAHHTLRKSHMTSEPRPSRASKSWSASRTAL
jgi:hypothetical protein